jgi:GTP-binding protein Era
MGKRRDGSVKIDQVIYVQREGQKAIVLGKAARPSRSSAAWPREELGKTVRPPVCTCSCS